MSTIGDVGEAIPCPAFHKATAPDSDEMGYPYMNRVAAPTDRAVNEAHNAGPFPHVPLLGVPPSAAEHRAFEPIWLHGGGEPARRCGCGWHGAAAAWPGKALAVCHTD